MEWTRQQQIWFLLQSMVLGFGQGVVLDCVTALAQFKGRRRWLWTDIIFGPIASVVTFFGALLICDGQLHPVVLFGVFTGMIIEHISVGFLLRLAIVRVVRTVRRIGRIISKGLCALGRFCVGRILRIREKSFRRGRKSEKPRKMSCFFQKKT